jgi:HSP20 family protein
MSKLADQLKGGYFGYRRDDTWAPPANLYESESSYLVCVDLAGVERETIDLTVVDGRLRLRGSRAIPMPPENAGADGGPCKVRVHLMEIDHGAFFREVELPADIAHDRISATHRNGMLWVELPKQRT